MEKKYVTPEADVVEFDEKDLLTLSGGDSGDPETFDWTTGGKVKGRGNW